jgi:V/A-type H+-transporting ATPase subunit C
VLELLARPGLVARLDCLKNTDYRGGRGRPPLEEEPDPLRAAERGAPRALLEDLLRIDRFLSGGVSAPCSGRCWPSRTAGTSRPILRGVAQGEPPERTFLLLAPTPVLDDPALTELVGQKEVKAVVDLLATWNSPYALPLTEALAKYLAQRELFPLEAALDLFLFARARDAARGDGEDGRILLAFLETQIDLTNAGTLLKLAGAGRGEELFVPGGRVLGRKQFQRLSTLGLWEAQEALARQRLPRPRLATMGEQGDPFTVDQVLHQALGAAMRREAMVHPLSLAVPLSFVLERQAEVRQVRLVLRGAEFGIPADEMLAFMES